VAFYAAITLVVLVAALLITWRQAWPRVWQFLVELNMLDASLLVAAVGVIIALGGFLTIRRITV